MFKERMTPEELANLTGFRRQTINKWVRKEQVREYIRNAERTEGATLFTSHAGDTSLETLLITLVKEMTPVEQKRVTSLLLREGITGLLQRLGIRDSK